MDKYNLVSKYRGYNTKKDQTKLAKGYLVEGSQNVLSTDGENIKIREGYTLYGASNATLAPVESSYDWGTHSGTERNLRSYSDELEVYYDSAWRRVADGWTAVDFQYVNYWDTDESEDIMLFVNGDSNVYSWSGGATTILSATSNTITKNGTTTWVEERFVTGTTYDKIVTINGTDYTYTGGQGTTTLTGVSPDPSGEAVDSVALQAVTTHTNIPASGVKNDIIGILDNQVYYGNLTNRQVFKSKVNDFLTVTFSSPRLPGEGALLTLDSSPIGFVVQESAMYIAAGKSEWYKTVFTLSADLTKESLAVNRLNTTAQEAAISQSAIGKIKNSVVYISNEPTVDTLGRVENIDTPQSKPISDSIKPTLDGYDLTNSHVQYYKNNLYIAIPNESIVLVYNIEKGFWEAPQILPVARFAIISGELYGHSNSVPETYKLFTGHNDNENPINAIAKFSYRNYGDRVNYKNVDELYAEGYISSNTTLTHTINYDYKGYSSIKEFDIKGNDDSILFKSDSSNSLGKNSFGKEPLGSQTEEADDLNKFRQIDTTTKLPVFFEDQQIFSSNQINANWVLLCFGGNYNKSTAKVISIKK